MTAPALVRTAVAEDLPVLRGVFGDTVRYAGSPTAFARRLAEAVERPPDPGPGRDLAASLTWAAAAGRHLEFYAAHPMPR